MRKLLVLLLVLTPALAHATTYEVGPGQQYANVGDVPWPSLAAGDTVRIHARSTPYYEKFIVNASGTASAPILIEGVADPSTGELPILDGQNAVEATNEQGYQDDDRFLIKVGDASNPSNPAGAAYLTIQNLHLRNAHPNYTFSSNRLGSGVSYSDNAAGIWLQHGDHLTIRGCELDHNGNGIFAAWGSSNPVSNVLVEANYLHDNGVTGTGLQHNSYIQVDGATYQFNHYGPPLQGGDGNNLKDRSSAMVARYNWLEGGERVMDLVDNSGLTGNAAYFTAYVYGNVLVKDSLAANNAIIHFGGDSGTTSNYRTTLWLWNNTIISQRTGNCTLLQLDTSAQTAHVLNDIIAATSGSTVPGLSANGTVSLDHTWVASSSGEDPGFVDFAGGDYHLTSTSVAKDAAGALPSEISAYPLDLQYVKHQQSEPRPQDGSLDQGAFEYGTATTTSSSSGSGSTTSTSGSTGSTSSGSTGSTSSGTTGTSSGSSTAASSSSGSTGAASTSSGSSSVSGSSGGSSASPPATAKGGCGCNAGGADLAFLALAVLALRRRPARS